ncbi:cytoplasmic protein [Cryptococcus gattii EJB2]|uniref:Cytoplasmic protein n=1 Tax=Cryptococcus gattii EJB2 TaxID=1296103 RepID=A0ABR5C0I1_9TREE|nr:cytoplasmic protein [Cryptococcus gattii EJB2]
MSSQQPYMASSYHSLRDFVPGSPRSLATGTWHPLPYIHSGFVIYPFHPEASSLPAPTTVDGTSPKLPSFSSHQDLDALPWTDSKPELAEGGLCSQGKRNHYEIRLDIGDEFYAFEEYRCSIEEDGRGDLWYRGFVVQAVSITSLSPVILSETTSAQKASFPRPEPSVLIGIFPASVCHVRSGNENDTGELSVAYEKAIRAAQQRYRRVDEVSDYDHPALGTGGLSEMDTVKEEDEEDAVLVSRPQNLDIERAVVEVGSSEGRPIDVLSRKGSKSSFSRPNRPKSLVLEQKETLIEKDKDQPPLPRLTAGDSTSGGQQWPLVDEIACAIREWYSRLPTYLANREYRLFNTVTQHIDALFLGRRQLLSQMLSDDELVRVRRECVSRLVKCNVAQGLDVIVRSFEDGSMVVVDKKRAYSGTRWAGGISCYVYQVRLAYIDVIPLDNVFEEVFSSRKALSQPHALTSAKDDFPDLPTGSFYHLFLDVRAFVANPCAPGETAELYFSLYNKRHKRFISEEFCLILNHYGSPSRDSEQRLGRLRTLFTDLKAEDLAPDTYLVCKIIRNGAMKTRSDNGMPSVSLSASVARHRSSLYDISATELSDHNQRQSESFMDLTDDSFSVTSGNGPESHRPPTVDTTNAAPVSMVGGGSAFGSKIRVKRPLGWAVMLLPPMSKPIGDGLDRDGGGVEQSVKIYVPREEKDFAKMFDDVIHNRVKHYMTFPNQSYRAQYIVLYLKSLRGPAPQLVREHPSLLQDIPLTSRLSFPDVVFPGQSRHDLYIKLCSATFRSAPSPSSASTRMKKNVSISHNGDVQVAMEIRKVDGTVIEDAIMAGGSGERGTSQWNSMVFHHSDKPVYDELVKIPLPIQSSGYHLFLTFRSMSKNKQTAADEAEKPFAFAYLPISTTNMFVTDDDHELVLYHMEKDFQLTPSLYFGAAHSAKDWAGDDVLPETTLKGMSPSRDRVVINTRLCSSVHTQDETLRSLFAWQSATESGNTIALCETLNMFGFVDEQEISRLVPRVLNSLFGILVSSLSERREQLDDLVFKGMVKVLAMANDRRFPNFKIVLNIYTSNQFYFPAASFHLLRSMKSVMASPHTKGYRLFLKVWHLFFQFIIRSREQDREGSVGAGATSPHIEAEFQSQIKHILKEINNLMESTDESLIGTQTLVVQHYASILPDLAHIFQPLEIAEMVIAFVDTLSFGTGSIATYKLLMLLQVVKNILETSESRQLLVPAIVRWLKPHLGRFDEHSGGMEAVQEANDGRRMKWLECNRLAVTGLAWMTEKLQQCYVSLKVQADDDVKRQEEDNIQYCLTLLPGLYSSYAELSSPRTLDAFQRQRSSVTSTIWKDIPDIFPTSHPFALISQLPPPSLLERHHNANDSGIPASELFNCGLAECAVVILNLILATPVDGVIRWIRETLDIEGAESCRKLFMRSFDFAKSVISFEAFPSQWLTIRSMSFSGLLKLLECIATIMEEDIFVPLPPKSDGTSNLPTKLEGFDDNLWRKYFELLCDFCGSQELALEDQTPQRRRAEWIVSGDLREGGARLLLRLWNAVGWPLDIPGGHALRMGGYQTRFTGLGSKVLELCQSSHDALCETAAEILFSLIYAEYLLYKEGTSIETEVFVALDKLFTAEATLSSSDPTLKSYFVAELRNIFESFPEIHPSFTAKVSNFLSQTEYFIDLLLVLRDIPAGSLWQDERATAIYQLMNFVNAIGRKGLYVRYVHELVENSKSVKDWLGAGLGLKLHADIYDWKVGDEHWVDAGRWGDLELPAHTQAEAHEFSLNLCQELITQHQRLTYDINMITELLTHQAKLWATIGEARRPQQEYFRVAYFGEIFSLDKNKDYVVRAQVGQKYTDLCNMLQNKYPQAAIHCSKIPPPESIKRGANPVIWVTPVTPEPDLTKPVFGENVSNNVQSYWRWNGIKEFSSVRQYLKDPLESETALAWTEKTLLTTKDELPGVLARSEIICVRYEQIPPIAMAIMEIKMAIKSLQKSSRGKNGQLPESKALGTAINNAMDSLLFIEGPYLDSHPEDYGGVQQLKSTIIQYVRAIQDSLEMHKRVCRDVAFHEILKNTRPKANRPFQ